MRELNNKSKQIANMEEMIKKLEVEKLLRVWEWEVVMKLFEITKRKAIIHKTKFLIRHYHLENVKSAVEATKTVVEPIFEQNKALWSLLEETNKCKILHDKTDLA